MPTTAEIAKSIEDRKVEITNELAKLNAASKALGNGFSKEGVVPAIERVARQQATTTAPLQDLQPKPKPRAKRAKKAGGRVTRKDQATALLKEKPRTIPELAAAMKIEPNYLYRVLPKVKGAVVDDKTKVWSIA